MRFKFFTVSAHRDDAVAEMYQRTGCWLDVYIMTAIKNSSSRQFLKTIKYVKKKNADLRHRVDKLGALRANLYTEEV